jgi:hypothetical protein
MILALSSNLAYSGAMNIKLLLIVATAVLAGILSGATLMSGDLLTDYGPGAFFGVLVGAVAIATKRLKPLGTLGLVAGSILAWYVALQLYIMTTQFGGEGVALISMVVAGATGSVILFCAWWLASRSFSAYRLATTIFAGIGAAVVMTYVLQAGDQMSQTIMAVAFAIWQGAVALALAADYGRFGNR